VHYSYARGSADRVFIRDFIAKCKEVLIHEMTEITALVRKLIAEG
jgi:hypothetical protein